MITLIGNFIKNDPEGPEMKFSVTHHSDGGGSIEMCNCVVISFREAKEHGIILDDWLSYRSTASDIEPLIQTLK